MLITRDERVTDFSHCFMIKYFKTFIEAVWMIMISDSIITLYFIYLHVRIYVCMLEYLNFNADGR